MKNAIRTTVVAASIAGAIAGTSLTAMAEPNMEKYNKSCVVCHDQGVAGAPKTGDAAAWAPRMEKSMDALLASVKNGLNAMPPMGMCMDCTDQEYVELIQYMASAE